jgi:hypothetical protein
MNSFNRFDQNFPKFSNFAHLFLVILDAAHFRRRTLLRFQLLFLVRLCLTEMFRGEYVQPKTVLRQFHCLCLLLIIIISKSDLCLWRDIRKCLRGYLSH